ncbi:hypothetical protein AAG747_28620 [Rapidithrix thailandica]|uniref:Uncharacterized protein n=1 Tax=Rapidithrix thailandica TaxID=413964 RepID=A0AAW9S6M1_9BACT
MLPLENPNAWNKLNCLGKAEALPKLLLQLKEGEENEVLEEICWEYIYHQNTLYQSTVAIFPHLMEIAKYSQNEAFLLDLFLNLGIILAELDTEGLYLKAILQEQNNLDQTTQELLYRAFVSAFEEFAHLGERLQKHIYARDEETKRYFFMAYAVANKFYELGRVWNTYTENTEYRSICPGCSAEHYLWNESDKLVLYIQDPVTNKAQQTFDLLPLEQQALASQAGEKGWLYEHIVKFKINSLLPLVPSLLGRAICPGCGKNYDVFASVINTVV